MKVKFWHSRFSTTLAVETNCAETSNKATTKTANFIFEFFNLFQNFLFCKKTTFIQLISKKKSTKSVGLNSVKARVC